MGIMKGVRTGTCNYRSEREARAAYCGSYDAAIKEGRISIGRPHVPSNCKLKVDKAGRYWLEEQ